MPFFTGAGCPLARGAGVTIQQLPSWYISPAEEAIRAAEQARRCKEFMRAIEESEQARQHRNQRIDRLDELIREARKMIRQGRKAIKQHPEHAELLTYALNSMKSNLSDLLYERSLLDWYGVDSQSGFKVYEVPLTDKQKKALTLNIRRKA